MDKKNSSIYLPKIKRMSTVLIPNVKVIDTYNNNSKLTEYRPNAMERLKQLSAKLHKDKEKAKNPVNTRSSVGKVPAQKINTAESTSKRYNSSIRGSTRRMTTVIDPNTNVYQKPIINRSLMHKGTILQSNMLQKNLKLEVSSNSPLENEYNFAKSLLADNENNYQSPTMNFLYILDNLKNISKATKSDLNLLLDYKNRLEVSTPRTRNAFTSSTSIVNLDSRIKESNLFFDIDHCTDESLKI